MIGLKNMYKIFIHKVKTLEESINDPSVKQEIRAVVSKLCDKWMSKQLHGNQGSFNQTQELFFSKTSRSHFQVGLDLNLKKTGHSIQPFNADSKESCYDDEDILYSYIFNLDQ